MFKIDNVMMRYSGKKNYKEVTKFRYLYDCKKNVELFFVIGEFM